MSPVTPAASANAGARLVVYRPMNRSYFSAAAVNSTGATQAAEDERVKCTESPAASAASATGFAHDSVAAKRDDVAAAATSAREECPNDASAERGRDHSCHLSVRDALSLVQPDDLAQAIYRELREVVQRIFNRGL